MQPETAIVIGLFSWLRDMPAPYPVAGPNLSFNPPRDAQGELLPYLSVKVMPARPDDVGVSRGSVGMIGIMQVSVFFPKGKALTPAIDAAGAIARRFAFTTVIRYDGVNIKITGTPAVEGDLEEDDRVQVPVSIPYQAFVPN